jgi:hypothetical protein
MSTDCEFHPWTREYAFQQVTTRLRAHEARVSAWSMSSTDCPDWVRASLPSIIHECRTWNFDPNDTFPVDAENLGGVLLFQAKRRQPTLYAGLVGGERVLGFGYRSEQFFPVKGMFVDAGERSTDSFAIWEQHGAFAAALTHRVPVVPWLDESAEAAFEKWLWESANEPESWLERVAEKFGMAGCPLAGELDQDADYVQHVVHDLMGIPCLRV